MAKTSEKQGYHHGDLRSALIANGLELLEAKEDGAIGLREVARETGVSATAVYRHFADKDALYSALAIEGFERLADAQEAAAANTGDRESGFRAIGQAYVHFAIANPALFRLMTAHMHLLTDDSPPGMASNRAAALLRDQIVHLLPEDAGWQERRIAAVQAWSLVHGLAMLVLGGQIPNDPELIDAAVSEFGWN